MTVRLLGGRQRLIWLMGVLLVAGFLATSLASYFVSTASVRRNIVESGLPLTSDSIYSEIQRDLLSPVFVSSLMAQDTFLRDWALDGEKDAGAVTKYLREIKSRYGTVTSFFVSERTRIYYHADGILKRVSPDSWRDVWYFRVREMSEPYEINVDPDMANRDSMTIFVNYRVLDYAGNFIGVTGVGLTVDTMGARIDSYRRRFGRTVYFVRPPGEIVLAGGDLTAEEKARHQGPGFEGALAAALAADRGSFEYRHGDETVLLNTRFIPELGWYLFVEQEESAATAGIRRTLILNLLLCLVITGIVVGATSYTVGLFQRRIEQLAVTDRVTGLLNRRGFELVLEQAMKESRRTAAPLALVLFDIDRFKQVNDRFGHLAGDAVIAHVGAVARATLRESDAICRWGGEEYLILLKGCTAEQAAGVAGKLGERIRASAYPHRDGPIAVTVSLGVAEYRAGEDLDRLLGRVDAALYDAKNSGRDRVARAA